MSFFDAMILGIVQGLTEFLPVSSSGHLVILENLLNIRTDTDVLFHVLLHFGTLIAICLVFKNDLFRMLVETIHIFQDLTANFKIYIDNKMNSAQTTPYRKILCNNYRTMVAMILISTIPTGILGYLLQNLVDRWSSSLPVTGLGLLITAVLLLVVDNWQLGNKLPKHITVPQALAIGVCQGISVIPGISRSGITITAGFLCGFRRGFAIRYSYLVSIPAILGAMILECGKLESKSVTWSLGFSYTEGMLTAAVVGYFSIRFMLAFIKYVDSIGDAKIENILDENIAFYQNRLSRGLQVDRSTCPYDGEMLNDRKAICRNMLANPFEKFERKRFLYYSKDLSIISMNHALYSQMEANDWDRIRIQLQEDLHNYYSEMGGI